MPVLQRGKDPPPRSPERQRLADAIDALAAAVAQADRVSAAQQKLDDKLFNQLQPKVRAAKKALDEAREVAPEALVDAVLAGETSGSVTSAEADAESALRKAEAAVVEASQHRRVLREEAERASIAVGAARSDLGAAVRAVVEADPAKQAVVAEFNRAAQRALRCAQVLKMLGVNPLAEAHGLRLSISIAAVPTGKVAFVPDYEWASALAALADDPDAPLPGLPPAEDGPSTAGAEAA